MPLSCVFLKPGTSCAELRTSCALPGFGTVENEKSLGKLSVLGDVSGPCLSVTVI